MTETEWTPPKAVGPFSSFDALKEAHRDLMMRATAKAPSVPDSGLVTEIQAFVDAASDAGTVLHDEAERQSAQNILDHWESHLIALSRVDEASWTPARLAEFVPDPAREVTDGIAAAVPPARAMDRERIRIAAVARQWRHSGFDPGYLLNGVAITAAIKYVDDPDVDLLVRKSQEAAQRKSRQLKISVAGVIVVLLAIIVALFLLWNKAEEKRALAEDNAEAARKERLNADDEAQEARKQQELAVAAAERAQTRLAQAEALQRQFDAALDLIRGSIQAGKISESDVPETIRDSLKASEAPARSTLSELIQADQITLSGYDPDFLGSKVPLPSIPVAMLGKTFQNGRPLEYLNYSLVLHAERQIALFTASNLDRQHLRVLPRVADSFEVDPRVPAGLQAQASWFADNDLDRGHLVTRQEIAWGPDLNAEAELATIQLQSVVNIYTNVTPQFDTFNQGVWMYLERWALTEFNKGANRVSIFSGPVLDETDPELYGARVPRRFWKVVVSGQLAPTGGLTVEAFLLPQFQGSAKIGGGVRFTPDQFRVRVEDLEKLIGLDFGEALRAADVTRTGAPAQALTKGDRLAAELDTLNAATADERKAFTQTVVNALRDQQLPDPEQRKVVAALAAMAQPDQLRKLSTPGRVNLLFILSQIPEESWDRPDWIDLKASARRAVVQLEAQEGGVELGPDARQALNTLKTRLDWGVPQRYTVYLQFAGITRESAQATSKSLQVLKWKIPGEERTPAAAKQNEVRYGTAEDQAAAELLAADLRAAGLQSVRSGPDKRNPAIKPGFLEIFISQ